MILRARWIGPPPRIGDYLMSEVRPRHAYRVTRVTQSSSKVRWDAASKAEVRQLTFVVDRIAAPVVPRGAQVFAWRWDKRVARSKGRAR